MFVHFKFSIPNTFVAVLQFQKPFIIFILWIHDFILHHTILDNKPLVHMLPWYIRYVPYSNTLSYRGVLSLIHPYHTLHCMYFTIDAKITNHFFTYDYIIPNSALCVFFTILPWVSQIFLLNLYHDSICISHHPGTFLIHN